MGSVESNAAQTLGRKEPWESHQMVVPARPDVASEKVGATERCNRSLTARCSGVADG